MLAWAVCVALLAYVVGQILLCSARRMASTNAYRKGVSHVQKGVGHVRRVGVSVKQGSVNKIRGLQSKLSRGSSRGSSAAGTAPEDMAPAPSTNGDVEGSELELGEAGAAANGGLALQMSPEMEEALQRHLASLQLLLEGRQPPRA